MQFGAQPPLSAVAGYPYPNGFPDPRRIYGIPGPPPPHPGQPNPYFPSWNSMPALGSPPGVLRPTVDGWYVPPNPPLLPNHLGSDSSYPYSPTLVSTPSITGKPPPMDTRVHDFWKGRFAPFPGTTSPPSLLGKTPSRVVTITAPYDTQTQSPAQRQPPHSSNVIFETSNKHATVQFTGKETEKEKEEEKETDKEQEKEKQPLLLDKYADIFIPQYLQDIQNQPHVLNILPPVPAFPSLEYLQRFLPSAIIDASTAQQSSILSNPPPATAPSLAAAYHPHWNALLSWELHKLAVDKEQIVIWKTGIKVGDWGSAEFLLHVPGIRENTPRLEIGDILVLREVFEAQKVGSGIAFEGRVVALRKREGFIHFFCPTLKVHIQTFVGPLHPSRHFQDGHVAFTPDDTTTLPLNFNINFVPTNRPSLLMDAASKTLHDAMSEPHDTNRRRTARRWLFPVLDDVYQDPSTDLPQRHLPDESWTDRGLNEEQKVAVSSIVLHASPIPFIILGPPGTGKTRTTVEAVLQILRFDPEACILLVAPSNPAVDLLAMRLRSALKPHEMLRLNEPNRTFAEVPLPIRQYCYVENDKYSLPPWGTLMRYRVVVCSCLDSGILVAAHCTNNALARLETEIVGSLHPRRQLKEPVRCHWSHLLIDEAAEAAEPELLIPMSVVLPGTQGDMSTALSDCPLVFGSIRPAVTPQLVLCGDFNQLGPQIFSDAARDGELDVSLLQRLLDRPVYAAPRKEVTSKRSRFRPHTNLVKNYRSHPAILMPPSAMFYDDSLVPCAVNLGTIVWSGLPNPHLPLLFVGNESKEECVDERSSWFNPMEIKCVLDTVVSLLAEGAASSPPLQASEIGVMAPFREQVWKIRECLRKEKLSAVDVGTVEDYQGREMRVILISCVRSSTRFLKDDLARGLGLVYEKKRMNVAITRAKELLIVIGNAAILQQDPFWRSFLQFMLRNKLYSGPVLDLELDGNYISRLESELVIDLDEEDRGVAMAGGIAREILRE
ncbi:P-loop containing nucleoside triphosphate hydrolase protein [Mycena epipterygia]|nr:P-loop containing nucleoside triphosphate hydrolase protein [Mycena epipterygia]